jgi:predicted amidohydrolase
MSRPLPLALVQAEAKPSDNLWAFASDLEELTRVQRNTQLFVYPEAHLCGPNEGQGDAEMIEAAAEPLDGPRGRALAELAGDLKLWLAPGSIYERAADGRIYNTAVVYSPEGRLVASYRKVFPWRPYENVAQGSEFVVFDMADFGRIGLSICYDAWFPECSRHLAWMGAELILNVVKTPTADRAQEVVLARANAIVNQVFVASVNAATPDGLGRSILVDPQGRVRAEADGAESIVLSDVIDLDDVTHARTYGTASVTRPWQQFDGTNEAIELPLYSGRIDPSVWKTAPGSHEQRN